MTKFSHRYGYVPIEKAIRREEVDRDLRIALWNVLAIKMWNKWSDYDFDFAPNEETKRIINIIRRAWFYYFNYDMDSLPEFNSTPSYDNARSKFKRYFFDCNWYEVFDFLEFLLQDSETFLDNDSVMFLNHAFKRANAAYQVIGKTVVEITDANEIKTINEALNDKSSPVRTHIQAALAMLSDRREPNYRNSIKESISAVEAACRLVTGMKKATLGEALKKIPDLHPAMMKGFSALYGFTSEASGVRHSLLEESNLTYADAKFMLSACSSFVSYLRGRGEKSD